MPGETSLSTLLTTLHPTLHPSTFVFITLPHHDFTASFPIPFTSIQLLFREAEGITLVTDLLLAQQHDFQYQFRSRMITLDVHSSLDAVGFIAVVASRLADQGISTNPVSGYYHDHLFVPENRAEDAVKVLKTIAEEAKKE